MKLRDKVLHFSSYRRHQKLKLRDKNWTISYLSSFSIEDNKNWSYQTRNGIFSPLLQLVTKTIRLEAKRKKTGIFSPSFQLLKKKTLEATRQSMECLVLHFSSARRQRKFEVKGQSLEYLVFSTPLKDRQDLKDKKQELDYVDLNFTS